MISFKDIARIFEEIEDRLIKSLKRNLSRHREEEEKYGLKWSAWQAEKLREVDRFRRECSAIVSEYSDKIAEDTRQLMQEQFAEGVNGAAEEAGELVLVQPEIKPLDGDTAYQTGEPDFFGVDTSKVSRLIADMTAQEHHVENSALRVMDDVYRTTVHKAQLAMSTGSVTLDQAVDMAVSDFLAKGINSIVYRDGRRVNIADYVRMALRTTSSRAALQGKSAKYKALGYDTVLVSSYGKCSPTCRPWQGRAYIDDVFSDFSGEIEDRSTGDDFNMWGKSEYCGEWFPLLSTALHHGLFHPNCRHSISLYVHGSTELPEPEDSERAERLYKAEQKQRALEREIRKHKRLAEGLSDPAEVKKAKKQLREAQKKLRDFIEQTNEAEGVTVLKRDSAREKIYGSQSSPSAPDSDYTPDVPNAPQSTAPAAPEGVAVDIEVPAQKAPEGAYSEEKIPEQPQRLSGYNKADEGNVHDSSIDNYDGNDIIESNNKKSKIPKEVIDDANKAYDIIKKDFPALLEYPSDIEYVDTGTKLGQNELTQLGSAYCAEFRVMLSDYYCSDYALLRETMAKHFVDKYSYESDNVGSLLCHEAGHSLHRILAFKRAGIKYGKIMSQDEKDKYDKEFAKIQQEVYLAAFADEGFWEIQNICMSELGSMVESNANELIAQSFGNYYYGKNKSRVANAIFGYFKRELSIYDVL